MDVFVLLHADNLIHPEPKLSLTNVKNLPVIDMCTVKLLSVCCKHYHFVFWCIFSWFVVELFVLPFLLKNQIKYGFQKKTCAKSNTSRHQPFEKNADATSWQLLMHNDVNTSTVLMARGRNRLKFPSSRQKISTGKKQNSTSVCQVSSLLTCRHILQNRGTK